MFMHEVYASDWHLTLNQPYAQSQPLLNYLTDTSACQTTRSNIWSVFSVRVVRMYYAFVVLMCCYDDRPCSKRKNCTKTRLQRRLRAVSWWCIAALTLLQCLTLEFTRTTVACIGCYELHIVPFVVITTDSKFVSHRWRSRQPDDRHSFEIPGEMWQWCECTLCLLWMCSYDDIMNVRALFCPCRLFRNRMSWWLRSSHDARRSMMMYSIASHAVIVW